MANAIRTISSNKNAFIEGDITTVNTYSGSIVINPPDVSEPVTLAEVQAVLAEAIAVEGFPSVARITGGVTVSLEWTEADL